MKLELIKELSSSETTPTTGFGVMPPFPRAPSEWFYGHTLVYNHQSESLIPFSLMAVGLNTPFFGRMQTESGSTESQFIIKTAAVLEEDGTWSVFTNVVVKFKMEMHVEKPKENQNVYAMGNGMNSNLKMTVIVKGNRLVNSLNLEDLYNVKELWSQSDE